MHLRSVDSVCILALVACFAVAPGGGPIAQAKTARLEVKELGHHTATAADHVAVANDRESRGLLARIRVTGHE